MQGVDKDILENISFPREIRILLFFVVKKIVKLKGDPHCLAKV